MHGLSLDDIAGAVDELALCRGRVGVTQRSGTSRGSTAPSPSTSTSSSRSSRTPSGRSASTSPTASRRRRIAVVERLTPHLDGYLRHRPEPWTIVHGDFRADNLLLGGRTCRRRRLADRRPRARRRRPQLPAGGQPATRSSATARASPRRAVRRSAFGPRRGPRGRRRCGTTIGATRYGGLIMAIVASTLVRRTDRGDEMFIAMADRHAVQALDLDSLALLAS